MQNGDRVRLIGYSCGVTDVDLWLGTIGYIESEFTSPEDQAKYGKPLYCVRFLSGEELVQHASSLELAPAPFKLGDRVQLTRDCCGLGEACDIEVGRTGEIVEECGWDYAAACSRWRVQFDDCNLTYYALETCLEHLDGGHAASVIAILRGT